MNRHAPPAPALIESLEPRRLLSTTYPDFTGTFSGQLSIVNVPDAETIQIQITYQKKNHFAGTFVLSDGSSGVIAATLNKRGNVAIKTQTTNLATTVKTKGTGIFNPNGNTFSDGFVLKAGRIKSAGSFNVSRLFF